MLTNQGGEINYKLRLINVIGTAKVRLKKVSLQQSSFIKQ